jgi:hypothetical protein
MISISDNTGTDATIHIVGVENVEREMLRNVPMLTTRDRFQFLNLSRKEYVDRWRVSDVAGRRAILAELDTLPLLEDGYAEQPYALDIEWHFSPREYCGVIAEVADMPIMSINSPIAPKDEWARVAFKGGSENGVIGLTTWMQAFDGRTYCISGTWNDLAGPVDNQAFVTIFQDLAKALR